MQNNSPLTNNQRLSTINIEDIVSIAKSAGDAIIEIYNKDFTVDYKDDKSPLTEADIIANEIICEALASVYPDIPLLSEENKEVPYKERKDWEYFWLIDPIDGTKEFIKKNGEFTVNIALIHKYTPVLGVVYAPALREMYWAKKVKVPGRLQSMVNGRWSTAKKKNSLSLTTKHGIQNTNSSSSPPNHISPRKLRISSMHYRSTTND